MFSKNRKENSGTAILSGTSLMLLLLFGLTTAAFGQTTGSGQSAVDKIAAPILTPVLTNYKEIKIGTTADEVRDKLGKAKIDDKDGFFYDADDEMVQIRLDKDKKVRVISITYPDENKNAPKYADVFGAEAQVPTKPDGSIYHLVRYPQAGYWVAYSRSAGKNPIVTVTMQKLRVIK
ncbi:MAG TPA: hypothetical protein VNI84_18415 [Pyrinomonadaceae bacterium]|nr:hypothetical protein [Pyrinomonadaceae bacterium]